VPLPPKRPGTAWRVIKWFGFAALALVCVVSVLFNLVFGAGLAGGGVQAEKLRERHLSGPSGISAGAKVAVVTVDDIIVGTQDTGPASWIFQQLKRAGEDGKVKAVLLDVDSPGGGITASDIIHQKILELKQRNIAVVVLMRDVAASGAYYISAPADRIIAHPTSLTGSIGVIISSFNVEGLFQKIGVQHVVFKSSPYKDILSPYRPVSEEERTMLQGITDQMFARFKDVVAKGRELTPEEADAVSNGAVFTAQEAKDKKLVDEIGYFDDAVRAAKVATKRKAGEVEVVKYEKPPTIADMLFGSKSDAARGVEAQMSRYIERHKPGFYYLWPGP